MRKILTVLAILISGAGISQNLQNSNWCFGDNAGLNFNTSPVSATTSSSIYNQTSGAAASVSGKDGQLLFYSNGVTVWGKNNVAMPNGTGLLGEADNYYHSQNTLIVPKPNHPGIYYLFTISYSEMWFGVNKAGVYYSIIDMCLNNGNGDIISGRKNIPLKNHSGTPIDYDHNTNTGLEIKHGKVTSTLNSDQTKVWLSVFAKFGSGLTTERYSYSYLISDLGINSTNDGTSPQPTSYNLLDNNNYQSPLSETIGVIKISPNGQYLSDASLNVILYNFNNTTGLVTFNRNIYTSPGITDASGYGLEFSPNSQLLYFAVYNAVVQEQLRNSSSVIKNRILIYQNIVGTGTNELIGKFSLPNDTLPNNFTSLPAIQPKGLQLGIDNKIYVCNEVTSQPLRTWLGIIQQPNLLSTACDYIPGGINLSFNSFHTGTLPQWVHHTKNLWPKVYVGKGNQGLLKDNSGNIYMSVHNLVPVKDQINHLGFSPPYQTGTPVDYDQYTFNFLNTTTNTVWGKPLLTPVFTVSNGTVQLSDESFVNALTGVTTSPPSFLPPGERIIAESNSPTQTYITRVGYNINFTNSSGSLQYSTIGAGIKYKFSTTSNKFYFSEYSGNFAFKMFDLTTNIMTQYPIPISILAVDNSDNVYVIKDNMLQRYDMALSFTPVSIPGFNNSTIKQINNDNPYAENKCLVFNESENNFYALDFSNSTSRKIHIDALEADVFSYLFIDDDVYLAGYNTDYPFYIGSQLIPALKYDCSETHNCFITKLNLQTDFSARESTDPLLVNEVKNPAFDFIISPNPANNVININISEKGKISQSIYSITILNNLGRPVIKNDKYLNANALRLYGLEKGIYYIELTNTKGEKITKKMLKRE